MNRRHHDDNPEKNADHHRGADDDSDGLCSFRFLLDAQRGIFGRIAPRLAEELRDGMAGRFRGFGSRRQADTASGFASGRLFAQLDPTFVLPTAAHGLIYRVVPCQRRQ